MFDGIQRKWKELLGFSVNNNNDNSNNFNLLGTKKYKKLVQIQLEQTYLTSANLSVYIICCVWLQARVQRKEVSKKAGKCQYQITILKYQIVI